MKLKRGQISIFFLFVLVIFIAAVLINFINDDNSGEQNYDFLKEEIKFNIEECVRDILIDGLVLIGAQGGYYSLPDNSIFNEVYEAPIYFENMNNYQPSISVIEDEINLYMDSNFFECVYNIVENYPYIEIIDDDLKFKSSINANDVSINSDSKIRITDGEYNTEVGPIFIKINGIRLLDMHNLVSDYMEIQLSTPDLICTSCLVDYSLTYNLSVDIIRLNDTTVYFEIIDPYFSLSEDELYTFRFANVYEEYSCENPPPNADDYFTIECVESEISSLGYEFTVDDIPDLETIVGERFEYTIVANGIGLKYEDMTELFDIGETDGRITFNPTENDKGEHVVWIKVTDQLENEKYIDFKLEIK